MDDGERSICGLASAFSSLHFAEALDTIDDKLDKFLAELERTCCDTLSPFLLDHFGNPPGVELKPDGSKVTASDVEAERILSELVATLLPHAAFLGEESAPCGSQEAQAMFASELLVVCDPIDGTSNFIAGKRCFYSLIAVCCKIGAQHVPVAAAVLAPALDELYITDLTSRAVNRIVLSSRCKEQYAAPKSSGSAPLRVSSKPLEAGIELNKAHVQYVNDSNFHSGVVASCLGLSDIAINQSSIWDVASPICFGHYLDIGLHALDNGEHMQGLKTSDFVLESGAASWKLHRPHVACRPVDLEKVSELLV